jgi:putative transposase
MRLVMPPKQPAAMDKGCRWLWLDDAARLAGITIGAMRNKCLQWQHTGMARKATREETSQETWQVAEHADPRFRQTHAPEQLAREFDWAAVPEPARSVGQQRLAAVLAFRRAREQGYAAGLTLGAILEQFLASWPRLSSRTIQRWDSGFSSGGVQGLLDGRRRTGRKPASAFTDFWPLFERWYLEEGESRPRAAYRLARAEARRLGIAVPSDRTASRYAQHLLRTQRGRVIRARQGGDRFDDQCAAHLLRDYTRIRVIENGQPVEREFFTHDIWCADHHICDVMVRYTSGGKTRFVRPWLTAWQDLRSRKIVGRVFSPIEPDSSSVLLALRDGILRSELCVPLCCYTDNGKDFDAWFWDGKTKKERRRKIVHDQQRFKGVYGALQIRHLHALPYNPKGKPVERFFRTFEEQFGVFQPTYTGGSAQRKPERLADMLKSSRVPAYEDFIAEADAWIEQAHHNEPHSGHGMDGLSPNEIYARQLAIKRTTTREALDILLLKFPKPLKVGRNGISFAGRTYGRGDPALRPLLGREVLVAYDPTDVTIAQVRDPQTLERICTVEMVGRDLYDLTDEPRIREVQREMNAHNRAVAAVKKRGMRLITDSTELLIEDALAGASAARAPEEPTEPNPPPRIQPLRTGFEYLAATGTDHATPRSAAPTRDTRAVRQRSVMDKLLRASRSAPAQPQQRTRSDPWAKATQLREAADGRT